MHGHPSGRPETPRFASLVGIARIAPRERRRRRGHDKSGLLALLAPLLNSEWVDSMVFWLTAGVKGGRTPASSSSSIALPAPAIRSICRSSRSASFAAASNELVASPPDERALPALNPNH